MILLPSAAGTVNAPPLMTVPGAAVVIDATWQVVQPIESNEFAPAFASAVAASAASRGGAFVERMKAANSSMSPSLSSPQVPDEFTHGVLSGTLSNAATELPIDVFSVLTSRLVIPISFKYASPANDSRLAFWFFHPKRPARTDPGDSRTGTWISCPRIAPPL